MTLIAIIIWWWRRWSWWLSWWSISVSYLLNLCVFSYPTNWTVTAAVRLLQWLIATSNAVLRFTLVVGSKCPAGGWRCCWEGSKTEVMQQHAPVLSHAWSLHSLHMEFDKWCMWQRGVCEYCAMLLVWLCGFNQTVRACDAWERSHECQVVESW